VVAGSFTERATSTADVYDPPAGVAVVMGAFLSGAAAKAGTPTMANRQILASNNMNLFIFFLLGLLISCPRCVTSTKEVDGPLVFTSFYLDSGTGDASNMP
jgi:hypothetical protein